MKKLEKILLAILLIGMIIILTLSIQNKVFAAEVT